MLVFEAAVLGALVFSAQGGPMFGVAARAQDAQLDVSDQTDVIHSIKVDRVTTPVDGWLIVQADWDDRVPDAILGSLFVPAGTSTDLTIGLDPLVPTPRRVFVTLLADGGQKKVLEYFVPNRPGMESMRGMGSTLGTGGLTGAAATKDRPVIAGGQVVSVQVNLTPMTFVVDAGRAALASASVSPDTSTVVLRGVRAPVGSWAVVSVEGMGGLPGAVIGQAHVAPGSYGAIPVEIGIPPGMRKLVATLNIDLGVIGSFEYTPLDRGNSPDQPYVAGGQTLAVPVQVTR